MRLSLASPQTPAGTSSCSQSFSCSNRGGFVPGNCDCQCQGLAPQPLVFVTSSHSWLASTYSIPSVYNQLETFCCTNAASPCDPSNLDSKWYVLLKPEVAWLCPGHWFSFCPLAPPLCRDTELSDAIKGQDTCHIFNSAPTQSQNWSLGYPRLPAGPGAADPNLLRLCLSWFSTPFLSLYFISSSMRTVWETEEEPCSG